MASYLVDLVLLLALVVTALKCGRVMREVRALKESGAAYAEALEASDRSINRAAEAVTTLKHEVLDAAAALKDRRAEAEAVAERLDALVRRAEWHAGGARAAAPAPVSGPASGSVAGIGRARETPQRVRASLAG